MRPIAVVIFAFVVLGGLAIYLRAVQTKVEATEFRETNATGDYFVELTLPFEAESNVFNAGKSLVVTVDGREILSRDDTVPSGILPKIQVSELKIGRNEFAVNAQPKEMGFGNGNAFSLESTESSKPSPVALRLRVFRDNIVVADGTYWSEPGLPIVATLMLDIPPDSNNSFDANE